LKIQLYRYQTIGKFFWICASAGGSQMTPQHFLFSRLLLVYDNIIRTMTIRPTTTATSTTRNKNRNSPEEVGGYPHPDSPSDMLFVVGEPYEEVGGYPQRTDAPARSSLEPLDEPRPIGEEGFTHQRKVRRCVSILFTALIVAVSVGVFVSNGAFGGSSGSASAKSGSASTESGSASTESGSNTPAPTGKIFESFGLCFDTTSELREAVEFYTRDNRSDSAVASTYGWPIGNWCVSNIEDFSKLFSVAGNPAAVDFNEKISRWDVSNATTMESMFAGSSFYGTKRFNQPLADWDVSSVSDMSYMFTDAISFNQPLGDWDVSSVTDMSYMFYNARNFNQPLVDWDVSSVTTMRYMFFEAMYFDQTLNDWNRHLPRDIDKISIFEKSGCPGEDGQECCFYRCSD
jgi:surface protein